MNGRPSVSPAFHRASVTSADGTELAVWRSGSGPSLVLVHGTTADHTRWVNVVGALSEHFTVHAMDRRGRGGSGDTASTSIELEGQDVVAIVAEAAPPVSVLGHSYGGLCALEAALRTPFHRLVLYEPPLPVGTPIVSDETIIRIETLIAQNQREQALLTFFREVVRVPEAQLPMLQSHPAWAGRVASAHTIARETRLEHSYHPDLQRLRKLETPTLLLLGGDSPPFLRDATLTLRELLPNNVLYEMPGQQHIAMDTIPDTFVRLVSDFLTT